MLLFTVVIAANDDDATDTLIEMEVSTLKGEEAAATEMLAEDGEIKVLIKLIPAKKTQVFFRRDDNDEGASAG